MFGKTRESVTVFLPDATANEKFPIFVAPSDHSITIEKVSVVLQATIAASVVNYLHCSLENGGTAGTATDDLGGTAGGTLGWTDMVPQSFSPAAGSGRLLAGQVLVLDYVEAGSVAPVGISVTVEYVHGLGVARN
jgi:hypothetical protein